MWGGTVYIISGLSLSLLIFSGCQQHFGDPSEQVSSQTRPCTKSEDSHTGRCLAWTKKKAHLDSRPCSKFYAPEGRKPSLSPGGSSLSRSGTGFWKSVSNSALVHEMSTQMLNFLACNASRMCPASGNAFQTCPHACWSSCLTFVFQHHPPLSVWLVTHRGSLGHPALLQTPAQCLRWEKGSMVTQGTETDTPREKVSMTYDYRPPWWSWFSSDLFLKCLMLNWWQQGDIVVWLLLDVGTWCTNRDSPGKSWFCQS